MTHTSTEREELARLIRGHFGGDLSEYTCQGLAHALNEAGYRRLPIDQARVGEIRERIRCDQGNFPCDDWPREAVEDSFAYAHQDRAYLLSLLEDTKP